MKGEPGSHHVRAEQRVTAADAGQVKCRASQMTCKQVCVGGGEGLRGLVSPTSAGLSFPHWKVFYVMEGDGLCT